MSIYSTCKSLICITVRAKTLKTIVSQFSTHSTLHQKSFKTLNFAKSSGAFSRFFASTPHENISSIPAKKRAIRKKKLVEDEEIAIPGVFNVAAFATSEECDLENLIKGLRAEDLYEAEKIPNEDNVVHAMAKAKYTVEKEPRDIFIFRDGGVVLWNTSDLETSNILNCLKNYEQERYSERLVLAESEAMKYKYNLEDDKPSCIDKDGNFVLSSTLDRDNLTLVKYTFSNAMFLSVKMSIWEASLEKYIDEIEDVTKDLKSGKRIKMTRTQALRKHGELFALRHYLNLSSDVLDTPDFYWENEQLENLYNQVGMYFCINKRTRVMNEKINHCVALIELLSHHLGDKHHIRLEWMIIVLIMVEVVFEIIHYIDRYYHTDEQGNDRKLHGESVFKLTS